MLLSLRSESDLRRTGDLLILGSVSALITFVVGIGFGYLLSQTQDRSVAVQMYVMAVDDGADIERFAIEQAGDQFTYQLPEHVIRNIQQSPFTVDCIDGLAISSIWTTFAEEAMCDGGPAIHVVLIAPY